MPDQGDETQATQVTEPDRLLRISRMAQVLLEEARQVTLDEPGRQRLYNIQRQAVQEISQSVNPELSEELERLRPQLGEDGTPGQPEIDIAQAQLVGWLEGIGRGIETGLAIQQATVQRDLAALRAAQAAEQSSRQRQDGHYL